MTETTPSAAVAADGIEARWPVALVLVLVLFVTESLPGHLHILPAGARYALTGLALVPMAMVAWSSDKKRWLRTESRVLATVAVALLGVCIAALYRLVDSIVGGTSPIGGFPLLTSSVVIWMNNMLSFAFLYWVTDRGGPCGRLTNSRSAPDWIFPQMGGDSAGGSAWHPRFVDYLSLSFWTATAFSPTDAAPLTPRAKLLMMGEASISLITLVVVASRAINVLGS